MSRSSISAILSTVLLFASVQGAAVQRDAQKHCAANSHWPGWQKIQYAFVFSGDSYSSTTFNVSGTQPTPTNPLGNPPYPGYTASNGPNWVDYLTVKYNRSNLLTYNLAYGGATIDSSLVAPYEPQVSSIAEQIENEFFPAYAGKPASAPWASDNTIFAIFDGINDVGNSYYQGVPATTNLNQRIFAVYAGLVDQLYYIGARNFAFLNVPPVDRSPLSLANDAAYQQQEKLDIAAWNTLVTDLAQNLKKTFSDVNVFTVDAHSIFTKVLDNPASYPQTALYKNTTAYCAAYQNGTPTTNYTDPSCYIPVNQYFWLNSLHPTYPMHDVLAQGVAQVLNAGPNVC
ncbi:fungal cellulose binding domain-containing protein [Rutstroemia sp. NJR-2017a WRK4]|nr:fungal cellulose binding domain-containing protein [Rutstroemia sp. NJR-2017a WRK4]